jgi:hypothetical protein
MIPILSILEGFGNLKKPKLKEKGRKHYRSAHGNVYRVVPSKKLTRMIRQRKTLRKQAEKQNQTAETNP